MRLKSSMNRTPTGAKKRKASDYGDVSEVDNMADFDTVAGGVIDEEEFFCGVDAMMPDDALDARQGAAMSKLFDFEMFERVQDGESIAPAQVHTMQSGQGGQWDLDALFV